MAPLAVLVRLLEDGCLHQDVTQDMSSLLLLLDVFLHQAITGPVLHANADEFAQSGVPCSYNHSKCGESGDRDGVKFLLPSWVLLVGRLGTVRVWQGFQRHLLSAAADEHRRGCLLRMLSGLLLVRACEREREREREREARASFDDAQRLA
jgi:hypothetical protein